MEGVNWGWSDCIMVMPALYTPVCIKGTSPDVVRMTSSDINIYMKMFIGRPVVAIYTVEGPSED